MRSTYDDQADALYVSLRERIPVARSIVIDGERVVDVDAEGEAVGVEVLSASRGVRLLDLVDQFGLEAYRAALRRLEASRFQAVELADVRQATAD